MEEAYIYARISADMEGDAHGVTSQLRQCREYAEQRGWTIAGEFVDNDTSAYREVNRPQFNALIQEMKAGRVPILISWHIDRLCRRVRDLSLIIEAARAGDTQIHTVKAGGFDLSTASGEMTAYLLGTIAQFEARHLSERQVASQHDRALRGLWRGGKIPFGYRGLGKGLLEIDEEAAAWLHTWRRWLIQGDSVLSILRRTKEQVDPDSELGRMNAYGLRSRMQNPAIAGLLKEHGAIAGKASWEPIFTEDEYESVLAIFRDPSRVTAQGNERKHQGSGAYRCGVCGKKMKTHRHSVYKDRRRYTCPDDCVSVDVEPMDEFIDELVIGYLSKPENLIHKGDQAMQEGIKVDDLRLERNTLVQRKDDLGVLFAEGAIDRGQLTAGTKKLQLRISSIDDRLESVRHRLPMVDLVLEGEELARKWRTMSADKRNLVIRELMDVTIVRAPKGKRVPLPERVEIEWKE